MSGVRVWRGEWCEGVRVVSGVRVWMEGEGEIRTACTCCM